MFIVIVQPEMPAAATGALSGIAGDQSPLTATQFAMHAANWVAIS